MNAAQIAISILTLVAIAAYVYENHKPKGPRPA